MIDRIRPAVLRGAAGARRGQVGPGRSAPAGGPAERLLLRGPAGPYGPEWLGHTSPGLSPGPLVFLAIFSLYEKDQKGRRMA